AARRREMEAVRRREEEDARRGEEEAYRDEEDVGEDEEADSPTAARMVVRRTYPHIQRGGPFATPPPISSLYRSPAATSVRAPVGPSTPTPTISTSFRNP